MATCRTLRVVSISKYFLAVISVMLVVLYLSFLTYDPSSRITMNEWQPISFPVISVVNQTVTKRAAFIGNTASYRLGGGEFFELTKHLFAKPILSPASAATEQHNREYAYNISAADLIAAAGESLLIFNETWCVCNYFLGWIVDWNMDIILWSNQIDAHSSYFEHLSRLISAYHVLFFYASNSPRAFPIFKHQKRFLIHVEAEIAANEQAHFQSDVQSFRTKYTSSGLQVEPLLVDVWGLTVHDMEFENSSFPPFWQGIHSLPSITWPYRYPMQWMQQVLTHPECTQLKQEYQGKILVFIARRCHRKQKLVQYIEESKDTSIWEIWQHEHNPKIHQNYIQFYCKLSITKYVFHFENYVSAGQTVGEAAVFGVPVFGYASKYLQSALMPRFLFVQDQFDWQQLVAKMEFLETHPLFYAKLSMQIQQRAKLWFIDSNYDIHDFLNDAEHAIP